MYNIYLQRLKQSKIQLRKTSLLLIKSVYKRPVMIGKINTTVITSFCSSFTVIIIFLFNL